MIYLRKNNERGKADYGWLKTQYSFSFSEYYDSNHMGFGYLRVLNEDHICSGGGFPTHPHKNMEIITYVISGTLEHKDSLGNSNQICAGEIQRMSAGKGIFHSEFNPSKNEECHLLQIWITPEKINTEASYEQINWRENSKINHLNLIVKPASILNETTNSIHEETNPGKIPDQTSADDIENRQIQIHQKTKVWAMRSDKKIKINFSENFLYKKVTKYFWLQLIQGSLIIQGIQLFTGDGLGFNELTESSMDIEKDTEFLLFEMWS